DLLASDAAQKIGRGCKDAEEQVGDGRCRAGDQLRGKRWRIAEIEDERTTRGQSDEKPRQMGHRLLENLGRAPGLLVEADARVAVALPEALDRDHEIGPDSLRAGVAAPDATCQRRDEEQAKGRDHQNSCDVIEFLGPDLEEEQEQPAIGEIEQYGLVGQIWTAVPAKPWQHVINAERDRHDQPLDVPEPAVGEARIDLLPSSIKLPPILAVDGSNIVLLDARG